MADFGFTFIRPMHDASARRTPRSCVVTLKSGHWVSGHNRLKSAINGLIESGR